MISTRRRAGIREDIDNPIAKTFGQRVAQIRKFQKLTVRGLVEKSGLTKAVIEATLKGIRYPESSKEIEGLADAFGITVARLKGQDVTETINRLEKIIESKAGFESALNLVEELSQVSVCLNDELDVMYYRGRILRGLGQVHEAEDTVTRAFDLVVKDLDSSDERFLRACNEVLQLYYYTNQLDKVIDFIEQVQESGFFVGNPNQQATLTNYHGFIYLAKNDFASAKPLFREAAALYLIAGELEEAGRSEANLGKLLFLEGSFDEALEHLQKAVKLQDQDRPYNKCVTLVQYARALFEMGKDEEAHRVIRSTIEYIRTNKLNFPEIMGKLFLMDGERQGQPEPLESALALPDLSKQIRINLHHVLTQQFLRFGNPQKALFHRKDPG